MFYALRLRVLRLFQSRASLTNKIGRYVKSKEIKGRGLFEDVEEWYEGTVLSLNRDERSFLFTSTDGEE